MFLVKIIEQWIVQSILVMQLKAFHITIWLCVRKSFQILRQHFSDFSFFWLHQDSFGILKAQDQIYFISIGIGQEKLDPNYQKMTKRVNEDLYEYQSKIHQNSYYLIVNVTKVTRTFLASIYTWWYLEETFQLLLSLGILSKSFSRSSSVVPNSDIGISYWVPWRSCRQMPGQWKSTSIQWAQACFVYHTETQLFHFQMKCHLSWMLWTFQSQWRQSY